MHRVQRQAELHRGLETAAETNHLREQQHRLQTVVRNRATLELCPLFRRGTPRQLCLYLRRLRQARDLEMREASADAGPAQVRPEQPVQATKVPRVGMGYFY